MVTPPRAFDELAPRVLWLLKIPPPAEGRVLGLAYALVCVLYLAGQRIPLLEASHRVHRVHLLVSVYGTYGAFSWSPVCGCGGSGGAVAVCWCSDDAVAVAVVMGTIMAVLMVLHFQEVYA